ncbi:MAG TPA: polymer-forming cytoskeletal protein [Acetobacteraceae bacterium]|jgi:cytoskeletal protein CcmA (bactofilin family)|nr:polymer-forming cytoskeletal protein [Acetobacteraceae bacterium]
MFNSSKRQSRNGSGNSECTSLIAAGTEIRGDVQFSGRLHIDGKVEGSIRADSADSVLTLSNHAQVVGEIHAPHIVINGSVTGDVTAGERLELAGNARVEGNIFYKVLEMSAGAQINGKMVHRAEPPRQLSGPDAEPARA